MKNPNQTFHQEQEAKTVITSSRPSHPALGESSGNAFALHVRISHMTVMPAKVRGARLLPSWSGSVWTVGNDYTGNKEGSAMITVVLRG